MIEEQATVIDREGDYVWVQTQRQSSCGQCSVKGGCGTQVLSKVLGNKTSHVRCLNSHDVKIGDRVIIGIEESALLSGSFLMYLLPLLSMILFGGLAALAAKALWPQLTDFLSFIASFFGLFLGLSVSQRISQQTSQTNKNRSRFEPVIIKKLPETHWQLKPLV